MRKTSRKQAPKARARKHLTADALFATIRNCFARVKETCHGIPEISLRDILMAAFAMFSLKDASLLAFDRRRATEEHNLRALYGIERLVCDTQMRARLDTVDPKALRPAFKAVFREAQRAKLLEQFVFMNGCYLVSIDGTGYFSSEKRSASYCMGKTQSKTGKKTHYLNTLAAVIVHPDRREVIPLAPEPISKQDGNTKNDCERNACRRWLHEFRREHFHLKVIVVEDGLASNGPHIRDLINHGCHFILGAKDGDHIHLFNHVADAVEEKRTVEFDFVDPDNPKIHHFFRFINKVPLNQANQDLEVNVLEYWEVSEKGTKTFSWVTDLEITRDNAFQIMRGGRARWKVENETFNTLKNQGYHLEHNYGLGSQQLNLVFVSLMMLAFLVDQIQQLACPLFREARQKVGTKRTLWELIRSTFHLFLIDSMAMIYRLIIAGPQPWKSVPVTDSA